MKQIVKHLTVFLLTSILHAGPPMMTDDPFTPDIHRFEVNVGFELEKSNQWKVVVPIIDVNYGISSNLQFTVERASILMDNKYNSDGVEIALKYHFYENDFFNIAIYPKYHFYLTDTSYNEGETYSLLLPMSLNLTNNLDLTTSVSYINSKKEGSAFEIGSYLSYRIKNQTYFFETYLEEESNVLNLGYFYQYKENMGLMFSIGQERDSLQEQTNLSYVGLQVTF